MSGKSGEGKKVCVTGASGYIASWIVKVLLDRGYTVNATVRSLNDPKKVDHLLALDGAKERLNLFEASLMEDGSFDSAIHGCAGVFHTASPVTSDDAPDPQAEIINPAVKGTLNVLTSCTKVSSVKRVVYTSSMASVLCTGKPINADVMVDESWFSIPEVCMELPYLKWYCLSKTLAEKAAWEFSKEHSIDLVALNPAFVIGPVLQTTLTSSVAHFHNLFINGSETYDNAVMGWVHVKDVADAHILAFETPSASGRYILNESVTHYSEAIKILGKLYPTLKFPHACKDDKPLKPIYQVSNEKVQSLGINYIPLKTSLKETVDSLKEKHFISI